jgi:hypothetical protein
MHNTVGLFTNALCFAILFPLLTRLVTRKWIGWKATLIAAIVYLAVGLLIDRSGILNRLPL